MNKIQALQYLVDNFNPGSHEGYQMDEWQEAQMYKTLKDIIVSPNDFYIKEELNALLIETYENA